MKLLIPMSGQGSRFKAVGFKEPKPLIPAGGKPIIQHFLEQIPRDWEKLYICNEQHLAETNLKDRMLQMTPEAKIVSVPVAKKGPVWATVKALEQDPSIIGKDENVLLSYCDYTMSWDARRFESFVKDTGCDGAIVCYTGFHPEYIRPQMYAYVRENEGRIFDIQEKACYTDDRTKEYASCGAYYFKSGEIVEKYFNKLMNEGPLINEEGYASLVYKHMLADGLDIRVFEIPYFMQWGTPADLQDYEYWRSSFLAFHKKQKQLHLENVNMLMPMAGRGSRFGNRIPKPMIPVMGEKMFLSAKNSFPQCTKNFYVVRDDFKAQVEESISDTDSIVSLNEVTEGQAITCKIGAGEMPKDEALIVTSCDHGIVYDTEAFSSLLKEEPDVVVFGQTNYSMADVTPKSFAYIKANENNDIQEVAVKETISETPRKDHILIGSFYFKSCQLMLDLIDELVEKGIRVNSEFYLDSVINLAVERNLKVKLFETSSYLCWGTPDSLNEFNYWYTYFNGLERLPMWRKLDE